ncbi:hypothetical protein [Burkholderia sola]
MKHSSLTDDAASYLETSVPALGRRELRERRIDELLESCRTQTLSQLIGPFGLTPTMFDDKQGGNITTTHNFEQGITATAEDASRYEGWVHAQNNSIDRKAYDKDLPRKRKELFQKPEPIISAATGKELPRDGQTHLDHGKSVADIERDSRANLYMNKAERVDMANAPENLRPVEAPINQSMGDKDKMEWANSKRKKTPGMTNAESFGVDMERLEEAHRTSERHFEIERLKAQAKKQSAELLSTSVNEAGRNALRQAMGVLLHEFVNSSYVEVSAIVRSPTPAENLVDRVVQALERTARSVANKMHDAFDALIKGGVQGLVSNVLTFLINNLITTSAKIVTIIRESMKALWQAFKVVWSPPAHMSSMDVAREATKLIAGVITMSLGMIFEESVKGLLVAIPFLAPIAGLVAPVVTGILTGLMTALTIFAIDRLFDWLSDPGTERLDAQISLLDAQADVTNKLGNFIEQQYANSHRYQDMLVTYEAMVTDLANAQTHLNDTIEASAKAIDTGAGTLVALHDGFERMKQEDDELDRLLSDYRLKN